MAAACRRRRSERRNTWPVRFGMRSPLATVMGPSIISGRHAGPGNCAAPLHNSLYTEHVNLPLLAVGPTPLALEPLAQAVAARTIDAGCDGAVTTFVGLVR